MTASRAPDGYVAPACLTDFFLSPLTLLKSPLEGRGECAPLIVPTVLGGLAFANSRRMARNESSCEGRHW